MAKTTPSNAEWRATGVSLNGRDLNADVLEVTISPASAIAWSAGIAITALATAFTVESWWTTLWVLAGSAAMIALISARSVRRVHTIDRRFRRITITIGRRWREPSRREIAMSFVNDVVLDESTKKKKDDGRIYEVPVYRVVYEMQDGTRIRWTDYYMEYSDDDFAVVDRVREALGLERRTGGAPSGAADPGAPRLPF
jgi:hypothetical protein